MSKQKLLIERDVESVMRDGTILRANVYRPDTDERLPVLLQRTPYNKDASSVDFCLLSASRRYAVVVQDTRGRWASDGTHYPMRDEFQDGYDWVEWAAAQPWANARCLWPTPTPNCWTQWAAASTQPPSLAAIIPSMTFTDLYADLIHPGGALSLGVMVSWNLASGVGNAIPRMGLPDKEKAELQERLADALDGMATGDTFPTLPLSGMPLLKQKIFGEAFLDMVAHESKDSYWQATDVRSRIDRISVPAYHLGGWYDLFTNGTLASYSAMVEHAGTPTARSGQKLIMGPWLHGPLEGLVGEVDFGVRASDMFVLSYETMWRWFDYWLKGIDNGIMDY